VPNETSLLIDLLMLRASIWETILRICCCRAEPFDCFCFVERLTVCAAVTPANDKLTAIANSRRVFKVAGRLNILRRRFKLMVVY